MGNHEGSSPSLRIDEIASSNNFGMQFFCKIFKKLSAQK